MCANQKGGHGKSLVIGTRVGHSVSVYADSFGYAHICAGTREKFAKKKERCIIVTLSIKAK